MSGRASTVWRLAFSTLAGLVMVLGVGLLGTGSADGRVDAISRHTSSTPYIYDTAAQHAQVTGGSSAPFVHARFQPIVGREVVGSAAGPSTTSPYFGVAAKAGAEAADHIALGLRAQGLEATAAKVGARTLLKDPEWQTTLQRAVADPSSKFTVSLDGMSGSSTYSQVMSAGPRGAAGSGGYTDWEMAQLFGGGRLPGATFLRGGSVVANPFG